MTLRFVASSTNPFVVVSQLDLGAACQGRTLRKLTGAAPQIQSLALTRFNVNIFGNYTGAPLARGSGLGIQVLVLWCFSYLVSRSAYLAIVYPVIIHI